MTPTTFLRLVSLLVLIIAISTGCRSPKIDDDASVRPADGMRGADFVGTDPGATGEMNPNDFPPIPRDNTTFTTVPETPTNTEWGDVEGGIPGGIGAGGDVQIIEDPRWTPIYFAYNRYSIGETERQKLSLLADYLMENAKYKLLVEGHADERGSSEFNRALAERRALTVKDFLVQVGVDASRIETISYGEERPADPGHDEAAWARNRRAEFVILLPRG